MAKITCKIHLGLWNGLLDELNLLENKIDDKIIFRPLALRYFNDNAEIQKKNAENYWFQRLKTKQHSGIKK